MKIAILGTAISSRLLAPFNDPTWEIWATGPASMGVLPKVDVWFELHSLDRIFNDPAEKDYLTKLAQQKAVLCQRQDPRIPGSAEFPGAKLIEKYGPWARIYWSSTIAFMLAYAREQKPEEVGLWGIDMAHESERGFQKPGCHYFLEKLAGDGVKITVPPQSDLLQSPPPYGLCEDNPMWQKLDTRRRELAGRINAIVNQRAAAGREEAELRGALEDVEYVQNTWVP